MTNYDPKSTNWVKLEKGLKKYLSIMDTLHAVNCEAEASFQKKFNGFYRVRKGEPFRKLLFHFLEANKTNQDSSFEEVLDYFFHHTGNIEASFSSKVLATIKPDQPVWDDKVLTNLKLKRPGYHLPSKERLQKIKTLYATLEEWYRITIPAPHGKKMVAVFDELVPNQLISITKKIDLILWQTRK